MASGTKRGEASALRQVTAIDIDGLSLASPPTHPPTLDWVDPTHLLVDEAYQRSISVKGQKLIKRILSDFDWRRFKPPTVVQTGDGFEVLDGQHSAIAAASHPEIDKIPVLIVDASKRPERASTFIGINRDRLAVNPMQLHSASVISGLSTALDIEEVCQNANIHILRSARQAKDYKAGDTIAVRAIEALIKRRGKEDAGALLSALSAGHLSPISAAAIKAAEFLVFNPDESDRLDYPDISTAIHAAGEQADRDASLFAAEHNVPQWRGLASVWRRSRKKRARQEPSDVQQDVVE